MNIALHIERLVLEGLPLTRAESAQLQAALERELSSRLSDGGLNPMLAHGSAMPVMHGATTIAANGRPPVQLGEQIAAALHGAIGAAK